MTRRARCWIVGTDLLSYDLAEAFVVTEALEGSIGRRLGVTTAELALELRVSMA